MDIKDLYPSCTYRHNKTWSVINDSGEEGFDFILDPMDFYHIYQSMLFPEQLAPIPLTREMLSEIGLIQTRDEIWFLPGSKPHIHSKKDRYGMWSFECGAQIWAEDRVMSTTQSLKYLHELQLAYKLDGVSLYLGTEKNFDDAPQT